MAIGVTSYRAVNLYKGRRVIASKEEASTKWPVYKLIAYCLLRWWHSSWLLMDNQGGGNPASNAADQPVGLGCNL
ncbi:hypothetical protein ACFX2F_035415 [Malus domestica]